MGQLAGVRKMKNKRGCYDRYEVIKDGRIVATYKITPDGRPSARILAQDHCRAINHRIRERGQ